MHRALQLFRRFSAERQAGLCVQANELYRSDSGAEWQFEGAIRLLQLSHDAGSSTATVQLGLCYLEGHCVSKDFGEAVRLFQLAAISSNAHGQLQVGQWAQ